MSDFKSKLYKVSDFVLQKLLNFRFCTKIVHSKNHVLTEFTPKNGRILQFLCNPKKHNSGAKGNVFEKQFF